jgi:hypothetical protein
MDARKSVIKDSLNINVWCELSPGYAGVSSSLPTKQYVNKPDKEKEGNLLTCKYL